MNKVFKVIWNHSTQTFSVVSELAKSMGKSSRTTDKRKYPIFVISAIASAVAINANAALSSQNDIFTNDTFVRLGKNASNLGNQSVVIGANARINGAANPAPADVVVIGYNAMSNVSTAVAIGAGSKVETGATHSVAIGPGATAHKNQGTAVGQGSQTQDYASALGQTSNASGQASTAIGYRAKSEGSYSAVLGADAKAAAAWSTAVGGKAEATGLDSLAAGAASKAPGERASALGSNANASVAGSVALGNSSTTASGVNTSEATVGALRYTGFDGETAASVVSVGTDSYKRQIQHVAAGRVTATSTDAINGSQLYSVASNLNNTASTVKNIFGGNAALNPNGSLTFTNIGGTSKNNINDAVKAATTVVIQGKNTKIDHAVNRTTGQNEYTVNAWNTTVSSDNANLVTVTATPNAAQMTTDYKVNVKTATIPTVTANGNFTKPATDGVATVNNVIDAVNSAAWRVTSNKSGSGENTGSSTQNVKAGDTVSFIAGDNIKIAQNGKSFTISAKQAGASTTSLTVNGDGKVANPAEGSKLVNATTVANAINDSGHKVATADDNVQVTSGANANGVLVKSGETVTYKAGKNLVVNQTGKNIAFGLAQDIEVNKVTANESKIGPVTINNNGIDAGNKAITNVANGTNLTDAVNISQLKANTTKVVGGTNIAGVEKAEGADGITYTVNAKGAEVASDNNSFITVANSDAGNNVTRYTLGVTTKEISTTPTDTGTITRPTDNGLATVQNVADVVNNVSWRIVSGATAQGQNTGSNTALVKAGDLVEFIAGENVKIDQAGKKFTISAKQADASTTDLTVNEGKVNTPAEGTKLVNATTVTNAINNSGHKVATDSSNDQVVAGTNTAGELIKAGETVTYKAGKNLVVNQTGKNITFGLAQDIEVNKVTANETKIGPVTINNNGIDAGNKAITNVANGTNLTDAVNISQLKANTTTVVAGTNIAGVEKTADANGITYTVNADGAKVVAAQNSLATVTAGAKDPATNVTTYTVDVQKGNVTVDEDTGVADSTDAGDKVATTKQVADVINASGWKLSGKDAAGKAVSTLVNPGDGVSFTSEGAVNVTTTAGTDGKAVVNVKVDGKAITDAAKGSITVEGDKAKTTDSDDEKLATTTDVVNAINNSGHKVATADTEELLEDSEENENGLLVKPGDKQTFTAGKNLEVKQTGANITFALSKDIVVNTVNATTINVPTGNGNNVVINNDGINAGNKPITNVADGVNNNDAVNISQLKANTTTVVAGTNIAGVEKTADANGITYKVNADGAKVVAGQNSLATVTAGAKDPATNVTTYTVDVQKGNVTVDEDTGVADSTDAGDKVATTKQVADVINASGWKLSGNDATGKNVSTIVNPGDGVSFASEGAVNVTTTVGDDGNSVINVKVDGKAITDAAKGSITVEGDKAATTDADDDKLATTTDVVNAINNSGHKVATADTDELLENSQVNADGSLVKPGDKQIFTAGKNLEVKQDGANITFALSKDIDVNKVTANELKIGPVTINNEGIDAGNKNISNVADGTEDHHAVNLKQLKAAKSSVEAGTNVAGIDTKTNADGSTTYVVNADGTKVEAAAGSLATVTAGAKDANNVTTYTVDVQKGNLTADKSTGLVSSTDTAEDKVATTKQVADAIAGSGWKLTGKDATGKDVSTIVNPGDGVSFASEGPVNVTTTVGDDGNSVINVKVDGKAITDAAKGSITVEGDKAATTDDDDDKLATTTDVVNAINNSGHRVATADTDEALANSVVDANGSLVKPGDKQIFTAGKNLEVKQAGSNITFALSNEIDVNKVTTDELKVGPVTINNGGIDAGDKNISNVADGTEDHHAVNVKQLKAAKSYVEAGTNVAGVETKTNADGSTTYVVNADGAKVEAAAGSLATVTAGAKDANNVTTYTVDVQKGNLTVDTATGKVTSTDTAEDKVATTKQVADAISGSGWKATVGRDDAEFADQAGKKDELINPTDTVAFNAGKNLKVKQHQDGSTTSFTYALSSDLEVDSVKVGEPGKDGKPGKDGTVAVNGKDGASVVINGKDGSIGLTGPKGKDGKDGVSANVAIGVGEPGVDGNDGVPGLESADGKPQKPRMEYTYDNNGKKVTEKVATLKDGLRFEGDVGDEVKRPLNTKLTVKGGQKDRSKLSKKDNIGVVSDSRTNSLEVRLAKDVDLGKDGSVTVGDTKVTNNGVTINNGPSITKSGVDAGSRNITNVKEGVKGTDAVNVNQLKRVNNRINKVNKDLQAGIAGATAMAFLQRPNLPGKSMVSAAVGGYKGESAVAVGYSRNSDNNKVSIKLGVGLNSRKDVTYGGSVGYQW